MSAKGGTWQKQGCAAQCALHLAFLAFGIWRCALQTRFPRNPSGLAVDDSLTSGAEPGDGSYYEPAQDESLLSSRAAESLTGGSVYASGEGSVEHTIQARPFAGYYHQVRAVQVLLLGSVPFHLGLIP